MLTGHPRYLWLNRTLHVGVGELRPRETRVEYDLFVVNVAGEDVLEAKSANRTNERGSLYNRLGGEAAVHAIARDFVDALLGNIHLNRQNRKVAVAHSTVLGERRRKAIQLSADMLCKLTGGPCDYALTRPLRDTHVHLDITEADWSLMRVDLERVLTKNHIAKAERNEVMAIIERTKVEIVKQPFDQQR